MSLRLHSPDELTEPAHRDANYDTHRAAWPLLQDNLPAIGADQCEETNVEWYAHQAGQEPATPPKEPARDGDRDDRERGRDDPGRIVGGYKDKRIRRGCGENDRYTRELRP